MQFKGGIDLMDNITELLAMDIIKNKQTKQKTHCYDKRRVTPPMLTEKKAMPENKI